MADTLTITDNRTGKQYEIPIENGAIRAMDLRKIRQSDHDFGLMTYDPAFQNTASCRSRITFIDGDKGILEYRGYPIDQLAANCTFLDTAYLLLFGELPTPEQSVEWTQAITTHRRLPINVKAILEGFYRDAHAMGVFLSTVGALSTDYPDAKHVLDPEVAREADSPADCKGAKHRRARLPARPGPALRRARGRARLHGATSSTCSSRRATNRTGRSRCSSGRSKSCSSCTPITSRTAARMRCAASAARRPIHSRRWRARPRRSTARSMAARTKPCC